MPPTSWAVRDASCRADIPGARVRKLEQFQPSMSYLRGKRRKSAWGKECPKDEGELAGPSADYWTEAQGDRMKKERDVEGPTCLLRPLEAVSIAPPLTAF